MSEPAIKPTWWCVNCGQVNQRHQSEFDLVFQPRHEAHELYSRGDVVKAVMYTMEQPNEFGYSDEDEAERVVEQLTKATR